MRNLDLSFPIHPFDSRRENFDIRDFSAADLKFDLDCSAVISDQTLNGNLQSFLLELGKGFAFVARQQRISTETKDFYIDLVFYNYLLKCFVLFDLKTRELTHQDIGQMDMYVRLYDDQHRGPDDGPTVGIILCSHKDHTVVRYSVLHGNEQLFATKYKLILPSEDELRAELLREQRLIEEQSPQ